MPAHPGAGLIFVQPHVAFFRLELGFDVPPGTAHISQGLQGSILRGVGQVVARLAAVQVTSPDGPDHLTGLAPLGNPHPPGAEHIAPRPLGSLRHRYLPPGLLRQLFAALCHGPPLSVHQPGFAGTPESLIVRTGPQGLHGPDGGAAGNVQHVPHPQGRQSLTEGRRHPEGVISGNPLRPEMTPLHGPRQHLQGQLRPFGKLRTGSSVSPPAHRPPGSGHRPRSSSPADRAWFDKLTTPRPGPRD